jgi:hypothetical protein
MVKGKWAAGIPPRNFTWVIKDRLAISERPGGFAPNHRKVRRQEEIIWLQVQGFTRVVSLLPSSHNLQAYEELDLSSVHFPLPPAGDVRTNLLELFRDLHGRLVSGERLLIHQEELGDRVIGVVSGYLLWSGRLPSGPQAVTVLEHITGHAMGPPGRELVAFAGQLPPVRSAMRAKRPAQSAGDTASPAAAESKSAGSKTAGSKTASSAGSKSAGSKTATKS